MNLRNTAEIELEEALKRYVASLMDSALVGGDLTALINNLKGVDATYKAIEQALDQL